MTSTRNRERGIANEFRVIDALRREKMTVIEVAALLGISRAGGLVYLSRLHGAKRIHIAGHRPNPTGRPLPLFASGPGQDAVYMPKKVRKDRQPDRRETVKARVAALLEAPHTTNELAEKIARSPAIARRYISELKAEGRVYIMGWQHPGHRGDLAPRYKLGTRKDAVKPKQTRAERWQKEKADPERHERLLKKRRHAERMKTIRAKPQGIFAALGV